MHINRWNKISGIFAILILAVFLPALSFSQTIPINDNLSDISVNHVTSTAIAVSKESQKAYVIDMESGFVSGEIGLSGTPNGVSVHPSLNRAYITVGMDSEPFGEVRVIDLSTASELSTIALGTALGDIAVDPIKNAAYIVLEDQMKIAVLDLNTGTVTGEIALSNVPGLLAIDTTKGVLIVTTSSGGAPEDQDRISVIDLASSSISMETTFPENIKGLSVNPDTGLAFILHELKLSVVDLDLLTVTGEFAIANSGGMALNTSTNTIAVSSIDNASIELYDAATLELAGYLLTDNDNPTSMAIDRFSNLATVVVTGGVEIVELPNPVPAIKDVVPNAGYVEESGLVLDIEGLLFLKSSRVEFDGDALNTTFEDNFHLKVDLPITYLTTTGVYPMEVLNPLPAGGISNTHMFFVRYPLPSINYWALTGKTIDLKGTNFYPLTSVYFNNELKSSTYLSDIHMSVTLNDQDVSTPGSYPLYVTQPDGWKSNTVSVVVDDGGVDTTSGEEAGPPPDISSFTPTSGTVGTQVTIYGDNFVPEETVVSFKGVNALASVVSATTIEVNVPMGASSGPITVVTSGGSATSGEDFIVVPLRDFSIVSSPGVVKAIAGQSVAVKLSLLSEGAEDFNNLAKLSLSGLPTGVTAAFNSRHLSRVKPVYLTLNVPNGLSAGTYYLVVSGDWKDSGTTTTRTTTVQLNVLPRETTAVIGRIFDGKSERPVPNVTLTMGGQSATTDDAGNFMIVGPPTGRQVMLIDGFTASAGGLNYASEIPVEMDVLSGRPNVLPYPIYLHRVNVHRTSRIDNNSANAVKVRDSMIPGFVMTMPKGAKIIGHDGRANEKVSITRLDPSRLPIRPIPAGVYTKSVFMFYFFKPGGGLPTEPIPITYPNDIGGKPGEKFNLYYYDESPEPNIGSNDWKIYGTGTVSDDGTVIVSDPGFGMPKFCCGATWVGRKDPPAPDPPCPPGDKNDCLCSIGDPVDAYSGAFFFKVNDLSFKSTYPIGIARRYNSTNAELGPFGIGSSFNYNRFLIDSGADLVYTPPGGGTFVFTDSGSGYYENTENPFLAGVKAYKDVDDTRTLVFKDGLTYTFNVDGRLVEERDRNDNFVTIERGVDEEVTKVTDTYGRYINLYYEEVEIGFNSVGGPIIARFVSAIIDFTGREVRYTYGTYDGGRLLTVTDVEGGVTTYGYDTNNYLTTVTDPRSKVEVTNVYYTDGKVDNQTHADGGVYDYNYTIVGSQVTETAVTDPESNVTTYKFNSFGYLSEIVDPYNQSTLFSRDAVTNKLLSQTDKLGRQVTYDYFANGNRKTVTDSEGKITEYEYEPLFNQVSKITEAKGDALQQITTFTYVNGNLSHATLPIGYVDIPSHHASGQPQTVTNAMGKSTTISYDQYGNPASVTDPLGNVTQAAYDGLSRRIKSIDPTGKTTQYSYDKHGNATQATDPAGGITTFGFDLNGNLTSITDPNAKVTTYTYNDRNRVASATDPLTNSENFLYDKNDNLTSHTDRKGQVTTYTYDDLDKRSQVQFDDSSTIDYTRDVASRLTQIDDSISGILTYTYGLTGCGSCGFAQDRIITETQPLETVDYEYDILGRRTSLQTYNFDPVTYIYDGANRLTNIDTTTKGAVNLDFTYFDDGRRASLSYQNGVTASYAYDDAGRTTGITHQSASEIIEQIIYGYQADSNIASAQRLNVPSILPTAVPTLTHNDANQMTAFDDKTMTYDLNGNLTTIVDTCGTTTYTWDARNRLTAISGYTLTNPSTCDTLSASFVYDALNRRIEKTIDGRTIKNVYSGADPILEIEGNKVKVFYLYGPGVDDPLGKYETSKGGKMRYLHADNLGSIIALTDKNGDTINTYGYGPFGKVSIFDVDVENPFQFTGRENDNTGLYYYRARYYSPVLQRFISSDPIGFAGGDLNLYGYVGNNPVNYTDPMGLLPITLSDKIIAVAISAWKAGGPFPVVLGDLGVISPNPLTGAIIIILLHPDELANSDLDYNRPYNPYDPLDPIPNYPYGTFDDLSVPQCF